MKKIEYGYGKNRKNREAYASKYMEFCHRDRVLRRIEADPAIAFHHTVWTQIEKYAAASPNWLCVAAVK